MAVQEDLDPALVAFRERCRRFAREVIAPLAERFDRENRLADSVHDRAEAEGLLHMCLPADLGGAGMPFRAMAEGGFELARACPAIAFTLGFNHGALRPVLVAGTASQRRRFVAEPLARGRRYASLALTEGEVAGSHLMAIRTRADRIASGWVLSGVKQMVGMGTVAETFLVLASTFVNGRPVGLSFFAVPRGAGVEVGPNTDKLGFRAVPTPEVRFEDVRLDDEQLIGPLGGAEPVLGATLDFIRFGGGIVILGAVAGALDAALPWLRDRVVLGGDRLIAKSHVQVALGRFYARLEAGRVLLRRVAGLLDEGRPCSDEAAMLKLLASELCVEACGALTQMHGWRGIDAGHAMQKRFRDAQQTTIFEGSSEVIAMKLCASLLESARARSIADDGGAPA